MSTDSLKGFTYRTYWHVDGFASYTLLAPARAHLARLFRKKSFRTSCHTTPSYGRSACQLGRSRARGPLIARSYSHHKICRGFFFPVAVFFWVWVLPGGVYKANQIGNGLLFHHRRLLQGTSAKDRSDRSC